MAPRDVEKNYRGQVRLDLCFPCAGIWFDRLESTEMAPGAVIELFKEIHAASRAPRQPAAAHLDCPRCRGALAPGYDLCKSGRFSYFRCARCEGRFTPFLQFLREKQFVRSLTEPEIQRIRAEVREIRCSECGAPIDLEHSSQCRYCQAPISFLDPDAVGRALQMWSDAADRRGRVLAPEAVGAALSQLPHAHTDGSATAPRAAGPDPPQSGKAPAGWHRDGHLDLVAAGISAIAALLWGGD
jgi:Zn-finger nucleic acid-binding protein